MLIMTVLPDCPKPAGRVEPQIDPLRCEGTGDCVRVCPYGVFELRALTSGERRQLPVLVRFRLVVHGGRQAFAPGRADCHACGLCVPACPERAIRLTRASAAAG
jgi:4Fe-4S ferredoxin